MAMMLIFLRDHARIEIEMGAIFRPRRMRAHLYPHQRCGRALPSSLQKTRESQKCNFWLIGGANMAIYHVSCSVKTGPLQSAVAASAYISGEAIRRDLDGTTKRYGRTERILDPGGIITPEHVPEGITDRASLWNAVEAIDGRRGQMCRSWNIALPHELEPEQQRELAREFIQREFVTRGMIADWAIHSDAAGQNPHLHALTTMRPIVQGQDGCWTFGAKARSVTERDASGRAICIGRDRAGHKRYRKRKLPTTDWNDKSTLVAIRAGWAALANRALQHAGSDARLDHRSYADQGIQRLPTVHMGYAATAMERRGGRSERGDMNRSIRAWNRAFAEKLRQIDELRGAIETERLQSEMPWNLTERVPWLMELRERMKDMLHQAKAEREALLPSFDACRERVVVPRDDLEKKEEAADRAQRDLYAVQRQYDTLTEELTTGAYSKAAEPGIWGALTGKWRQWSDDRDARIQERKKLAEDKADLSQNLAIAERARQTADEAYTAAVDKAAREMRTVAEAALPQTALIRRLEAGIAMADEELDRIETAGKAKAKAQKKGGTKRKDRFVKALRGVRATAVKAAKENPPGRVMEAVLKGVSEGGIPPVAIRLEDSDDDGLKNWDLMTELERDEERQKQIMKDL